MAKRSEQAISRVVHGSPGDPVGSTGRVDEALVGTTESGKPVHGARLGSEVHRTGIGNEEFSRAIRLAYDRSPRKAERDLYRSLARANLTAAKVHVKAHSAGFSAKDHYDAAGLLHGRAIRLREEAGRAETGQERSRELFDLAASDAALARVHADEAVKRRDRGEAGVPAPRLDLGLVPGKPAEQRAMARAFLARGEKPIRIERLGPGSWRVWVLDTALGEVGTKEAAKSAAHQVGRYRLELGDMAYGYVDGWE